VESLLVAGGGALLIVALLALLKLSRRGEDTPLGRKMDRELARAIESGRWEVAAVRATTLGEHETALDMFLRAQKPGRAAQLAHRIGRVREAAELYERADELELARAAYEDAGVRHKAQEIAAEIERRKARSTREPPTVADRAPAKDAAPASLSAASPNDRAEKRESAYREAALRAGPSDAAAQAHLRTMANDAAEAWLSVGDIRRAARVSADAGLVDQAVNLYVNVLGDASAAAALLDERGDHRRAAELFEAGGQKDRALASWVSWGAEAPDPLGNLQQVSRLGAEAPLTFLESVVERRPITEQTTDLHYRVALAMEEIGKVAAAVPVLEGISRLDAGFRDVVTRLDRARAANAELVRAAAAEAPRSASLILPSVTATSAKATLASAGIAPSAGELERVLDQAARAAAERAAELVKRGMTRAPRAGRSTIASPSARGALGPSLGPVLDVELRMAKDGPSVQQLNAMTGGRSADLGNIEVYWKLAFAFLAAGRWDDAREAFAAVEDASPGYREAWKAVDAIDAWRSSIDLAAATGAGLQASRYTVLGELGRGGMAVVYRARDEALGREVALKFLPDEMAQDQMFMSFFQREARAAASLNHPNIVTIYDVGMLDSRAFISMELVDGASLETVLDTRGPLPVLDVMRVAEQVLSALSYAHARNIVHRDIKPANVMRTQTGLVKLMDFGLAKQTDTRVKSTLVAGTPAYMAPEQMTGRDLDGRADLFALGATLYECLSGELPFEGYVRSAPPPPLREHNGAVPAALEAIVAKALAFEREDRYGSAEQMLEPLRTLLAATAELAARPDLRRSSRPPRVRA
jgi:serine/threonine-protein kinase